MSYYLPIPSVVETDGRTERHWDIYSRLLKDRIVFIGSPIDDYVANGVIAQLLFLYMEDPKKDISLYINSPGGSVTDGMAIYDTINYLRCDVSTTCIGQAASMGTVLLAGGAPGKTICSSSQPGDDSPADRICHRTDLGYLDRRQGDPPVETDHEQDLGKTHKQGGRTD